MSDEKPTSRSITLLFKPCHRSIGGDELMDHGVDAKLFRDASRLVAKRRYQHRSLGAVEIEIDWTPFVERHLFWQKALLDPEIFTDKGSTNAKRAGVFDSIRCEARVTQAASGDYRNTDRWVTQAIEKFLYDTFLILNLSVPGSFDLYGAPVFVPTDKGWPEVELGLSNYHFEDAYWHSKQRTRSWVEPLDLERVLKWHEAVSGANNHLPASRMEAALTVLLHMSLAVDDRYSSLVWLAYFFESIFQTPRGGYSRFVATRASRFLGADQKSGKEIAQGVKSFYGLRGSYVHGEMKIAHPLELWSFEEDVELQHQELGESTGYMTFLAISCLQECVRKGIKEINYAETQEFVSI